MSDILYYALRALCSPLSYRARGTEHIQRGRPALFIGNHAGLSGPFQAVLTLPARLYPWVIAEMTDPARINQYVYAHFSAPIWRLRGWIGALAARAVASIVGSVLIGIDCIPLDRSRSQYQNTFRRSLRVLERGRSLLIFPENLEGSSELTSQIRPFMPGFVHLCALYRRKTGGDLSVYPIAIVQARRMVAVGEAVSLNFTKNNDGEIHKLSDILQDAVSSLYLSCLKN